ncbi:S1 family peptidase [Rhodococcus sp. NPDC058514]|uniref:S1 family peptidase n=1 Tax=unclassified Rhodococcus (in: high G+C Gram-positive bacteria) TaxID=192944 RepID=UPI0036538788
MRSVRARRAAMIGSAALLLIAPGAALAHAEPATPAPAAALPADLISAIQRDLGLSPDQYLDKAEAGQKLVAFANTMRGKFPESFAGAWLDPAGSPLIGLADGPGREEAAAAVESAGYRVKDLPRSERALRDQLGHLNNWIEKLPAPLSGLIGGAAIDTVNNDVVLRVQNTAEGQGLALPDFLESARVVLAPALGSSAPPAVESPVRADARLGGDSYAAEKAVKPNGAFRCSLGFNGTDGSGRAVNISAGHCDPNRAEAGTGAASVAFEMRGNNFGNRFGTFAKSTVEGLDYSVIRIDDAAAQRFENNFVRAPGAAPVPITGTADPVVGAPVCKSGLTTGFSCGTINSVNQIVDVGTRTLKNGFTANICALQGDSGGAIVTGTRALGISSASNVGDLMFCEVASVVTTLVGDSPQLYATPINDVLAANPGLKVRTN